MVSEAGVNRNSFYYRFSDCRNWPIPPFCIRSNHPDQQPHPDPNGNPRSSGAKRITATLANPEQRQRLDRLALLAGPHSTLERLNPCAISADCR